MMSQLKNSMKHSEIKNIPIEQFDVNEDDYHLITSVLISPKSHKILHDLPIEQSFHQSLNVSREIDRSAYRLVDQNFLINEKLAAQDSMKNNQKQNQDLSVRLKQTQEQLVVEQKRADKFENENQTLTLDNQKLIQQLEALKNIAQDYVMMASEQQDLINQMSQEAMSNDAPQVTRKANFVLSNFNGSRK